MDNVGLEGLKDIPMSAQWLWPWTLESDILGFESQFSSMLAG